MIDPRVHYVGASKLRQMNAAKLRQLGDELYVIQCPEPVQVLIGYEHFMRIQETIEKLERAVRQIIGERERERGAQKGTS